MTKIKHLGIIMDGNRRWAKENSLRSHIGHQKGYEKLIEVGKWCIKRDIKILSVYAFSTENWQRSEKEVSFLMKLFKKAFTKEINKFQKDGIKLRIIGSKENLSKQMLKNIKEAEEKTKNNTKGTLNLCFNYGGRLEIVEATKEIIKRGYKQEEITEDLIKKHTWTGDIDDPDLIIRTSGEKRLSGFLTWQSIYSELYFTNCHWPAFSEKELDKAIDDFSKRKRKFGGN